MSIFARLHDICITWITPGGGRGVIIGNDVKKMIYGPTERCRENLETQRVNNFLKTIIVVQ